MRELVLRAKSGDAEAFVKLMEMNKQSMYKVARGFFSDMSDVEDAMADTVMTCWMKISTVRSPEYFKTWLTKILINKCCDILRKRKYCVSLDELPNLEGVQMDIEAVEFEDMVNALNYKYSVVLILHYSDGFGVDEIAEILKLPKGTVTSRLKRGREQLAKMLKE